MLDLNRLHGIVPPIVTPLADDETIDHPSLRRLIDHLIEAGVHGIWVLGTTGEFASFTRRERAEAVHTAVEAVNGRVPVVVNISDAATRLAMDHARDAAAAGADAIALLPPYYYANEQDELLDHFRRVRAAVDLPLLAYNIPQNVKAKFSPDTILRLGQEGTIVGLKDSQNDLDWFRQVMSGARNRGIGLRGFLGTRYLIDAGILAGAHGAIPGIANIAARECVACYDAARRKDFAVADAATERIIDATRISSHARGGSATAANFATMKAALKARGIISTSIVSAPLRNLTPEEEARVAEFARQCSLAPAS
ncbi:MAG: dihydrodipicolinate synthase family protein [Chloroflexi bacterium]|nr:dihydrodipicolinate synthase family protein [Chloroflexota bacterium]